MSNDDLLRPTLSDYTRPPALYHTTGFAMSAFFGGPVGAAVYSLANTTRLSRLKQDAPIVVVLTAVALLIPMMLVRFGLFDALADLAGMTPQRTGAMLLRGLGLAIFGAIYLLHRRFFRSARVSGCESPAELAGGYCRGAVRLGGKCRFARRGFSSIIDDVNDQPTSAAVYAEQAFYFIERRRLADAKRVLAQALTQYPQDPDLLYQSAQAEWLGDENETAEKTVRQVLVANPEHASARQLLASMLVERGEYADAELLLIGLLRDYPESAELYGRYSQLMLRTLHLEKAEQLAREGLRYDPEDDECLMASRAVRNRAQRGAAECWPPEAAGRTPGVHELGARPGRGAGGFRSHRRSASHCAGRDARRSGQRTSRDAGARAAYPESLEHEAPVAAAEMGLGRLGGHVGRRHRHDSGAVEDRARAGGAGGVHLAGVLHL